MEVLTYIQPVTLEKERYPVSYVQFVSQYGYGTYAEVLIVTQPDEHSIYNNFFDVDFWEFNDHFKEEELKNAIQIGNTIDGDILCFLKDKPDDLFVLPRNSENIGQFAHLEAVFDHYNNTYAVENIVFEPSYGRKSKLFSLIHQEQLLDINLIHQAFLQKFTADVKRGSLAQPRYIFKTMGGWVSFDLLYGNSITFSYQETTLAFEKPMVTFITEQINTLKK